MARRKPFSDFLSISLRGTSAAPRPTSSTACSQGQSFDPVGDDVRDELLGRLSHYRNQVAEGDAGLEGLRAEFPQVEALLDLSGIGLHSAPVVVAELGQGGRFRSAHQAGAYAGLMARVRQSGGRCHHGPITREVSRWLRWLLTRETYENPRSFLL